MLRSLDLNSTDGAQLLARVHEVAPAGVAAMAHRLERIFAIDSPLAPRFRAVGGVIALEPHQAAAFGAARVSVTGNGETVETALTSCLAEGADFLSQVERPGDIAATGRADELAGAIAHGWIAGLVDGRAIDWVAARDAATDAAVLLPADLCLRRAPERRTLVPPGPLSSGAAAGPSFEAAALRAILELCERDAVALWWHGGRAGRGFPLEHEASRAAAALLERLRDGAFERRTWLLDITAAADVPVVAAVSTDTNGQWLACGSAARCNVVEAARAAVLEMCQMELAAPLAAAKRLEAGDAALNEADRRHLRRAAFDTTNCRLLWPNGMTVLRPQTSRGLTDLLATLNEQHFPIFVCDMTRADIGVHAVRAVSPALQPFAPTAVLRTARLCHAIETSGGAASSDDIPLM